MNCAKSLVSALAIILLSSCQHSRDRLQIDDYAAWSGTNKDGSWTQAAENAVAETSLSRQIPKDIRKFCPNYSMLSTDSRVMFWAGLLSAMAKFESNFNPETAFTEELRDNDGNKVVSRGLLQISVESANQRRYDCQIGAAKDLHDPATNISCGARILSTWVESDGVVAYADGKTAGGARYWSVMRASNRRLDDIRAMTQKLDFCAV